MDLGAVAIGFGGIWGRRWKATGGAQYIWRSTLPKSPHGLPAGGSGILAGGA